MKETKGANYKTQKHIMRGKKAITERKNRKRIKHEKLNGHNDAP